MSNVSEPREIVCAWNEFNRWIVVYPLDEQNVAEFPVRFIEHSAFEALRKSFDKAVEIANKRGKECDALTKARDAALAERDNALQLTVSMASERAELRARLAGKTLDDPTSELLARLDAQRLINEAQGKAGEEIAARAEALRIDGEAHYAQLTAERARTQALVEALDKIADPRKRDHKEPDAYTTLGCVMHIAEEALAAHRAQEGEE